MGMPKLVALMKPCVVLALALVIPLAMSAVPAHAQGLFGIFKIFSRPPDPIPAPQPFDYRVDPALEQPRRKARPRPKPAEQAIKKPVEPKAPGEIDNPFPALLADSTLRPGDMVMFPDGLRVFTGKPGDQHRLADFKLVSQAGKAISKETRKLAGKLIPGENIAWSTGGRSGSKLAANVTDVETTGSLRQTGRRGSPRVR
jgi:hypothetical protein